MSKLIIQIIVLILFTQSVISISSVQHSISGNKVIFTFQGQAPFYINIRADSDLGMSGGYVYAKTDKPIFTFNLDLIHNPTNHYYFAVKDTTWSKTQEFTVCTDCQNGIYYKKPSLVSDVGEVTILSNSINIGSIPLAYDITENKIISGENNRLLIITAEDERYINTNLLEIARPSLSPDGNSVVVQAIERYSEPEDLNIYIVNMNDGSFERISQLPYNEENPIWLTSNKILYNSFSEKYGIKVHLYDVMTKKELWSRDQESFDLSSSPDGQLYMNTVKGTIHDLNTGAILYDINNAIKEALFIDAYELDRRFPGQANLGACPLASNFSPNGKNLVFDCAVKKDDKFGVILMTYSLETRTASIISKLINHNPQFTNNNNFSPTYPKWR